MEVFHGIHPHFQIRAELSAVLFFIFLLSSQPVFTISCLLAAAFHEIGHLLAAWILQIRVSLLRLDLFGAQLELHEAQISYGKEFFLAAAGPFFSFLLYAVLYRVTMPLPSVFFSTLLPQIRDASLFLGILNLVPLKSFDGGRMLSSLLSSLIHPYFADVVSRFLTGLFLLFLWGISVYLLLIAGVGLTLFIFTVGVFGKIFLL